MFKAIQTFIGIVVGILAIVGAIYGASKYKVKGRSGFIKPS